LQRVALSDGNSNRTGIGTGGTGTGIGGTGTGTGTGVGSSRIRKGATVSGWRRQKWRKWNRLLKNLRMS